MKFSQLKPKQTPLQNISPLSVSRSTVTHSMGAGLILDRFDITTYVESIPSELVTRGDINWRVLNMEVGFRYLDENSECSVWVSDFVHPLCVPHIFSDGVCIHHYAEIGCIDALIRHRFLSTVMSDVFENANVRKIYAWIDETHSNEIKNMLVNLGWHSDLWYLYS
jgi:hypothetical protein